MIGYIAQGFEGALGSFSVKDADGTTYKKPTQWAFPRDKGSPDTSTNFSGHTQYNTDWAAAAAEGPLPARPGRRACFSKRAAGLSPVRRRRIAPTVSAAVAAGALRGTRE